MLWIGQCNNTITYERWENVLLAVTGTSSSQVASMLKEKLVFLRKHDQALFAKDFRDHLTKSLKAKTQSIAATAEVRKSSNRRRVIREGLSFYQGRPNGRQKFKSNYNGKYILFQKKGTLSQHQANLPSSYNNMKELTHVHAILKKLFSKQKN